MRWWETPIKPSLRRNRALKDICDKVAEGGSSSHSAQGRTLRLVLERLEDMGIPYDLKAVPGQGYSVHGRPKVQK